MNITETKYVLELTMRKGESVTTLEAQLSEFFGMVLPLDGGGKAVIRRGKNKIACCGFTSRENGNSFEALRSTANS